MPEIWMLQYLKKGINRTKIHLIKLGAGKLFRIYQRKKEDDFFMELNKNAIYKEQIE